jgi:hypothetical protein
MTSNSQGVPTLVITGAHPKLYSNDLQNVYAITRLRLNHC